MNNSYLLEKYKTSLERRVEYRCYEEEKEQERKFSCGERWEADSEGEWDEVNNCKEAWKGHREIEIFCKFTITYILCLCVYMHMICITIWIYSLNGVMSHGVIILIQTMLVFKNSLVPGMGNIHFIWWSAEPKTV